MVGRNKDHANDIPPTVTLGAPRSIPQETLRLGGSNPTSAPPRGNAGRNNQASDLRKSSRSDAKRKTSSERIILTRETMDKVQDAVNNDMLLPRDASRDKLMVYNKL